MILSVRNMCCLRQRKRTETMLVIYEIQWYNKDIVFVSRTYKPWYHLPESEICWAFINLNSMKIIEFLRNFIPIIIQNILFWAYKWKIVLFTSLAVKHLLSQQQRFHSFFRKVTVHLHPEGNWICLLLKHCLQWYDWVSLILSLSVTLSPNLLSIEWEWF